MSIIAMVIGRSGSGKSRSMIDLNPKTTALINVCGKPLPFRGASSWQKANSVEKCGSIITADDYAKISASITHINKERPDIKIGVIDDFQYIMANEYMRRGKEKSFEKFTDIATNAWNIIRECLWCRDDLIWFFLAHSDTNENGETCCKTIGKLLNEKICLEGMFSIVLNAGVERVTDMNRYYFETQTNGHSTAKTPDGMFNDFRIENDLNFVDKTIREYYGMKLNAPESATSSVKDDVKTTKTSAENPRKAV